MKKILTGFIMVFFVFQLNGQNLPQLKVSDNQRYITTVENEPFFWLGGTAWELIHRLTKEEIDLYLTDRARKGFTVIQTVILAERDGLNTPNAYGHKPLIGNNPEKLNEKYFELVDYVIDKSKQLGLYVGLLPTWGDKFNKGSGVGPEIFDAQNAEIYGELVAKRYLSKNNIIWILGGDRLIENDKHSEIIRAMAKGIRNLDSTHLITFHPAGGNNAIDFFNDKWLDLDMFQSGHSRVGREYTYVIKSWNNEPKRPVINGESRYENIEDRFWLDGVHEWLDDADVRVSAYWSILSGAAGYTYGCNDIWQMYDINREPIIQARTGWKTALKLPGSSQMGYMKNIFESLQWQLLKYDPSLIKNDNPEDESFIVASINDNSDIIVAYTPMGKPINIDVSKLEADKTLGYWFNPRSGELKYIGEFDTKKQIEFKPWAEGRGSDFLLILSNEKLDFN